MNWLSDLFTNTESVAHIAILYAVVIAIGVYLGKIKFFGIFHALYKQPERSAVKIAA